MPHDNLPERWIDGILASVAAVLAWIGRRMFRRLIELEQRVEALEQQSARAEERHDANIERLDRIDRKADIMDRKLDRLIERRP